MDKKKFVAIVSAIAAFVAAALPLAVKCLVSIVEVWKLKGV